MKNQDYSLLTKTVLCECGHAESLHWPICHICFICKEFKWDRDKK
jgi:hypothetical protein